MRISFCGIAFIMISVYSAFLLERSSGSMFRRRMRRPYYKLEVAERVDLYRLEGWDSVIAIFY